MGINQTRQHNSASGINDFAVILFTRGKAEGRNTAIFHKHAGCRHPGFRQNDPCISNKQISSHLWAPCKEIFIRQDLQDYQDILPFRKKGKKHLSYTALAQYQERNASESIRQTHFIIASRRQAGWGFFPSIREGKNTKILQILLILSNNS
jgi:hypothetical protein